MSPSTWEAPQQPLLEELLGQLLQPVVLGSPGVPAIFLLFRWFNRPAG